MEGGCGSFWVRDRTYSEFTPLCAVWLSIYPFGSVFLSCEESFVSLPVGIVCEICQL